MEQENWLILYVLIFGSWIIIITQIFQNMRVEIL